MLYMGYIIVAVRELVAPSGRSDEAGVFKGSVSRPRSISTYMMGGGIVLGLIGLVHVNLLILLPGALLFCMGVLVAVFEAIFEP